MEKMSISGGGMRALKPVLAAKGPVAWEQEEPRDWEADWEEELAPNGAWDDEFEPPEEVEPDPSDFWLGDQGPTEDWEDPEIWCETWGIAPWSSRWE